MIKKFKYKFLFALFCLFTFSMCFYISINVFANEVNSSYDYNYELTINDNSYYLQLNNVDYSQYYRSFVGNSYDLYVEINGVLYDRLSIINSEYLGGIEIFFVDLETNNYYYLLIWSQELEYIDTNRYNLYFNNNFYTISLDIPINTFIYFSNRISGYYTFNRDLIGLTFTNYNFNDSLTTYSVYGSLVYQTSDNTYLFNHFEFSPREPELNIYMYNPKGETSSYYIGTTFEYDYLRYLYFDSQYIDTILYEWLKLNGIFDFSYNSLGYNTNFWDLVNAYVNIPITIISGLLDISIFNTGITILVVFASILAIFIAFKIVRLINWS